MNPILMTFPSTFSWTNLPETSIGVSNRSYKIIWLIFPLSWPANGTRILGASAKTYN